MGAHIHIAAETLHESGLNVFFALLKGTYGMKRKDNKTSNPITDFEWVAAWDYELYVHFVKFNYNVYK